MRILAFLLPLVALLALGVAGGVAWFVAGGEGDGAQHAAASPEATPSPTLAPETARPRLKPGQTVCQGVLHVPEKGQPRVFPDVYSHVEDVRGIAVVGSEAVPQAAFDEARHTI